MNQKFGELVPVGGGDPIPLLKKTLLVGRRETCDVVLRFANVSSNHCQLYVKQGYWFVEDQNSRNGTKVNGKRVRETDKRIDPGTVIAIAKHEYQLQYDPLELGATGPPPAESNMAEEILGKSLLERAGIGNSRRKS
ncbi:FHA domain-containing protein [Blastopirellula marina]|uniref:Adenylate cyclase n=1 Tax=Blastopirellula marina TaxID=124 RepID=A0A2S8G1K8_9BACT|nr:FHA domain-containing protein [Blastopirellula marina]PQO38335.1 adenylate cyclase [Blastopirellula marina]PTL44991.1 adenylate cyclase [Blastopirellula marina]